MNYVVAITISDGLVISSIRIYLYNTIMVIGYRVIHMPRSIHIISVVGIDVATKVAVVAVGVVVYIQATHLYQASVFIPNTYISSTNYSSEIIIINGNVFNLNNRSIHIILYIGVVVIPRIECNRHIWIADGHISTFMT